MRPRSHVPDTEHDQCEDEQPRRHEAPRRDRDR
jgi:hypothetical protein